MSPFIPIITAFFGTVFVVLAVGSWFLERQPDRGYQRLQSLLNQPTSARPTESIVLQDQKFTLDWLNALEKLLARIVTLDYLVEQAGLRLSTTAFFAWCGVSSVVGTCVAIILSAPGPLVPLASIAFLLLPLLWLMQRRSRRLKEFAVQLPDALEMISRGLRAGHSVPSAMQLAAQEMLPPLSLEFERCCQRQALGVPLAESLEDMLRRVPSDDVRFFYTALKLQQKFGGNLAEVLDTISTIVRDRFQIMGQVQALTGEGRLSGMVLLLLPAAVFCGLYYFRPDYLQPLFTDPIGRQMLGISVVLQIVGALTIRKIVSIRI